MKIDIGSKKANTVFLTVGLVGIFCGIVSEDYTCIALNIVCFLFFLLSREQI